MKLFQLFVVYVIVLAQSQVSAQSYTTIVDNGASSNRLDVVFMGDGYTSSDIAAGTYDQHINNVLSYMFSDSLDTDPFYRYRNFFNVHKIDVVSNESGADVPSSGIVRDTALDASYGTGGIERLLSINHSKANAIRNTALFGAGFGAEMLFTPVNTTLHGGSGNAYAVYAGGHGNAVDTAYMKPAMRSPV